MMSNDNNQNKTTLENKQEMIKEEKIVEKKWYEKDTDEWTDDDQYEALEDLFENHH